MNDLIEAYKEFIGAFTEFDLVNKDKIIGYHLCTIEKMAIAIENRLCDLVPEYKAELDNLDSEV